jgi:hypothetical protein
MNLKGVFLKYAKNGFASRVKNTLLHNMWYKLCCMPQRYCVQFVFIISSMHAEDQEINGSRPERTYFINHVLEYSEQQGEK